MKSWWRFLIILMLGLTLSFISSHSLTAEVLPHQLVRQAQEYYQQGEFNRSIKLLEQAHQLYQRRGKYLQQAQILSLSSLAQQQVGNWDLAQKNIVDSFSLLESVASSNNKTQVSAQIWNTKGHFEFARGNHRLALEHWQQAEELYRKTGDRLGIAGSLLDIAQILSKMGFYPRSCDSVLKAFNYSDYDCQDLTPSQISKAIAEIKKEPEPWQVEGLNIISNSLLLQGKLSQAETFVRGSEAINSSFSHPSSLTEAKIWLSWANIHKAIALRNKEIDNLAGFSFHNGKAIKYYQKLIDYRASSKIARTYQLPAQLNLLSLFVVTQQWSKAQKLVSQIQLDSNASPSKRNLYAEIKFALDLERLKQNRVPIEYTWQDIGDLYLEIIQQAQKAGDLRAQSYGLGYLGSLHTRQNLNLDTTPQQLIQKALNLVQQVHAPEIAYRWQWKLGQIYTRNHQKELAISSYQTSLATLADLRKDTASLSREIQFDFYEQIEPIYREYANLLLNSESVTDEDLETVIETIESLQLAELDNYFQDACTTFDSQSIDRLDGDTAVIYTLILPDRLEVIMVMNDTLDSHPHKLFRHHTELIAQRELEKTIRQLRQYITEPDRTNEVRGLSAQLYDVLIRPFAEDLATQKPHNLVFVLDTIMQNIPMSVLYDGEEYLLEKYAIALTPGLRMLNPQKSAENSSFLAGGITQTLEVGERKFPALNFVSTELNIFKQNKSQILINDHFTPDSLLEQINLTSASHIHIATHGQFSSDPNQAFLLMWQKLLTIEDFSNILLRRNKIVSVPIDLLVLSACDTASGDRRAALGLAGIAVRSGALSTLGTLWQVNDASTAALMQSFYQQLKKGSSKAEALRLAQLELWQKLDKDWQVPAFWSAYVMLGNWQ
ncbi:CHAT domain-containing protein [Waterburya agarophytonicola K14]|uniref:CHAT domain-containing protein n=1 Tax=Waterburya agarophytonicola KI4 TaxID=2874699 RepID=A0A964BLW9_9CYAN|nr:CHAT domain-containing protein [Waterburya agarophytonicola]MCC0175800.1 CHAT domain-containing protein [Waterburya agarophytonicola KI4]